MNLRPYQTQAVNALRNSFAAGNKHVILCAPTGAGKTVIFSYMVAAAAIKGKKILIVTDRIELLTQAGGALSKHDIDAEKIEASSKPNLSKNVFIGMVETISRRLAKDAYKEFFNDLDLIIFDEAHKQPFNKLFPFIAAHTYVIGATATPHRESNQACLSEFYTDLIEVIDIPSLIEQGYLARPRSFGVKLDLSTVKTIAGDYDARSLSELYERKEVYKGVVKNYTRICDKKKALVFSSTIDSSLQVMAEFKKWGYDARHLDSENFTPAQRREILDWYEKTPTAILCNVGILTTGFDSPTTECVILYRATKSLPLFLQMCGRGARVTPTKKEFFILDFGNNLRAHNLWQDKRDWSLFRKEKKKGGAAPVKECPKCEAIMHLSARTCLECGHIFEGQKKTKTAKEVELEEIGAIKRTESQKPKAELLRNDTAKLILLVKAGLLKPSYIIYNKFTKYADALDFTRKLGYKDGWLWHQFQNGNFQHLQK